MLTIYTAIYGGCDPLHQPLFHADDIRYVCYTDSKWNRADGVKTIVGRPHSCPIRASRWHKTHPPKGDSIWIDGSYQVIGDPRPFFSAMSHSLALIRHSDRGCAYQEAIQVAARVKDDPPIILRQAMRYTADGMPPGFGLWQGGLILRRADCSSEWQDGWWDEIERGSHRDQISLAYSLWKHQVEFQTLQGRPMDVFAMHKHPERLAKQEERRKKKRLR